MSETLQQHLIRTIRRATGSDRIELDQTIQTLWSGYGSLDRYRLQGGRYPSVVVKHVRLDHRKGHPRGWNSDRSHQRKLRSYQVETHWYQRWASRCVTACRVPRCLLVEHFRDEVIMVMEDLNASGFPARRDGIDPKGVATCLRWLANFHATFMGEEPQGLWPIGSYWHLATRPDELAAMEDGPLKEMAPAIDQSLNNAPFQTFIHGDAKLANFCFSADDNAVAAVDFQYVGGGCGMKDLAYFISSCYYDEDCERLQEELLALYFEALGQALAQHQPQIDAAAVEAAWRPLYPVAWADFYRFLKGWSPGHWKIHGYSERIAEQVIIQMRG
jgi:hypothetical protein